jgi:preprotein translocase subunit SecD
MFKKLWVRILFIALLIAGCTYVNFKLPLRQGLDLKGGSLLIFEADTSSLTKEQKTSSLGGLKTIIERRVNLFGISEPNVQTSEFQGKDRIVVELAGIDDPKKAIDLIGKTAQLNFAEVVSETEFKPTQLGGADLKDARVAFDQTSGKPVVALEFTDQGGQKFADITAKNIGKPLLIVLDGNIIQAPIVQEQIVGGKAEIRGDYTLETAKNLAIQLSSGALPISIKLVDERTVGASLGAAAIEKSVKAGLVGIVVVILFMILMYRGLGIVADIGLIIFAVITLALYKIIPVTLTLPGIAGFLLSVGMAVDSNILIFERYREERAKGASKTYSLEASFGRAWDSIRDANIATLMVAFILANPFDWSFLHTSGPVRGFAITLALGIGVSMFTGIFVSRNLLRFFIKDKI